MSNTFSWSTNAATGICSNTNWPVILLVVISLKIGSVPITKPFSSVIYFSPVFTRSLSEKPVPEIEVSILISSPSWISKVLVFELYANKP
jgi:hypothetical protein